jgi:hypothetical protein
MAKNASIDSSDGGGRRKGSDGEAVDRRVLLELHGDPLGDKARVTNAPLEHLTQRAAREHGDPSAWKVLGKTCRATWRPKQGSCVAATASRHTRPVAVAAFKRAAALVRKHNPHALIQWNIAWGQPDPTPYWPGAYDATNNPGGVDVVSMDFYQANISQYNNGGKQSAWSLAQSGVTISLDWMVTFAQQKGVKVALSEYGAGSPRAAARARAQGSTTGRGPLHPSPG